MTQTPTDLSSLRIRRDDPPAAAARGKGFVWAVVGLVAVIVVAVLAVLLWPRAAEVRVATASSTGGGSVAAGGISANGYVVARTKASVSAKVPGRLEYLGVSEGSTVRLGEVIARIESADYAAALQAARATVSELEAQGIQAKRDLDRAQRLRDQAVVSEAELEDAGTRVRVVEAQTEAARARVRLAEANFENTRVRAPFHGTILRKDAEVGEIVAPSAAGGGLTRTAIVTMADLGTLEVEVDVNEAYIARIRNAQPARITLDAYPDTSFSGKVRQVVPTADRQKATVLVKVAILDRDPRILPEMGAKVVFETGETTAGIAPPRRVLVPTAAVVQSGDERRVWVVNEGRVAARTVEVGPERGDQIEVRSGLNGGESVVLSPAPGLKDGARVRVAGS